MPFMEEDSTDSEASSRCSGSSPHSTATDATSVSVYREYDGCQKRKRTTKEALSRKKSRTEPGSGQKAWRKDSDSEIATPEKLPKHDFSKVDSSDRLANLDAHTCGSLPTSVWKSVFAYLAPRSLGNLLSVSSGFYSVLTGSPRPGIGHVSREGIHKDSERIWTVARQRYHPHFPRPLHGYRELDMWKLVGSVECQFCAQSPLSTLHSSKCHTGDHLTFQEPPRTEIYWPLAVRSCQGCLGKYFLTESELGLLRRSHLIPAMNYALAKHTSSPMVPTSGSKIFLRSHMEWLHAETEKIARESGSSAIVTTWLKTYEMNARKRQRDSSRWERWEATNGRAKLFPKIRANSTPSSPASTHQSSPILSPQSLMSDRHPSPATSDSSTMSKNKNRKSKNRARNNATATGANAVPTGGQTAPMSRAAFNHQGQPVLPLNSARVPPAFGSPSSIVARNAVPNSAPTTPISSFCRSGAVPFNSLSNHPLPSNNTLPVPGISKDTTGSLLDAIKAITHPIGSTARGGSFASSSAGQHAASFPQSLQQQPASTLQPLPAAQISAAAAPFIQRAQTIMPSSAAVCATMETPPVAPPIQPISACTGAAAIAPIEDAQIIAEAVRRQSSICPEEVVKIESDGPELPQLTRPTRQSPKIQTLERESLRQRERATGISRIQYLPESHYRSRSRTPPHDRKSLYRERDYFDTRHLSTYDHLVQPHAVRHVPQVLYDEYGNEYVRTGRRPNPYVLYEPPPSRGY